MKNFKKSIIRIETFSEKISFIDLEQKLLTRTIMKKKKIDQFSGIITV